MKEENKVENYWILIPPQIAGNENLPAGAKLVFGRIFALSSKEGYCWASNEYLSLGIGLKKTTVRDYVLLLAKRGYIRVELDRNEKKQIIERRIYLSLVVNKNIKDKNKSIDKIKREIYKEKSSFTTPATIAPPQKQYSFFHKNPFPYKKRYSSLESIGEAEFQKIALNYQVPIGFVRSKYDDLVNYVPNRTGKPYRNYYAALRNFVKKDALKIRKEASQYISKRGIDARNVE